MIELLSGMPDGVVGGMRKLTHAFSRLSPSGMRAFPVAELDAAKTWVSA